MRVGLLWRNEWDAFESVETCRLHGVFAAFAEIGVAAMPIAYSDERVEAVRDQLLALDGVLVWVNPIEQGRDRAMLDLLLRAAADNGVFVSAHPDVILKMGTKDVLVATRSMSWGTDARFYRTAAELRERLPARLAEAGAVVLKQQRGMGGQGVWKVELADTSTVVAQHAADAAPPEQMPLEAFLQLCEPYFAGTGLMVEQPYQPRLPDGMVRAYLTHGRVVGFTHQYPRGLLPLDATPRPSTKVFEQPTAHAYRDLRARLESEWVPELQRILDIDTNSLPVIWDADFLYGPKGANGADTFTLCEINVSSTFAFPEFAMPAVAQTTIQRIRQQRAR